MAEDGKVRVIDEEVVAIKQGGRGEMKGKVWLAVLLALVVLLTLTFASPWTTQAVVEVQGGYGYAIK